MSRTNKDRGRRWRCRCERCINAVRAKAQSFKGRFSKFWEEAFKGVTP